MKGTDRSLRGLTFCAIGTETTSKLDICRVGVVTVRDGGIADEWSMSVATDVFEFLFDLRIFRDSEEEPPEEEEEEPIYPDAHSQMWFRYEGSVFAFHSESGRLPLTEMEAKHGMKKLPVRWADAAAIAKATWKIRHNRLARLAQALGLPEEDLKDALGHARTTARVLVAACRESGADPRRWLAGLPRPEGPRPPNMPPRADIAAAMRPSKALAGETVVFTGEFALPRKQLREIVALAGGKVGNSVSKNTTMIVTGRVYRYSSALGSISFYERLGASINVVPLRSLLKLLRARQGDGG